MAVSPDVAEFAFTDAGPWVVDPARLTWRHDLDLLRARTRAAVPRLLAPRRLPPAGRLARVLAGLVTALGPWYVLDRGKPRSRAGLSRRLRRSFERLGSTYVKLGQIISAFEGLFPDELVHEFKHLRDQVPARAVRRHPQPSSSASSAGRWTTCSPSSPRSRSRRRRSRRSTRLAWSPARTSS